MTSFTNLTELQRSALNKAIEMLRLSYNPYSHFAVGACLVMVKDDELIGGANVENAAYGPTICAERSAVVAANAAGKRLFQGIAITGKHARTPYKLADKTTAPCGVCRQVLYEMTDLGGPEHDPWVVLGSPNRETILKTSVRRLLPHAFGPSDLNKKLEKYRR